MECIQSAPLEVTLPFELISYIVLLTSGDKPTLGILARTSRSLHSDAVKHLYASTPVLHLKWADQRATAGMQFLSTIHNSPKYATLVHEATIAIVAGSNPIPVRVVINELKKMTNITSLIIIPFYGSDDRVVDVQVPQPLLSATFQYRLRRLTWRGLRTFNSLDFLCTLLESHRATLEAVDLRLDYEVRHTLGYSRSAISSLVRRSQARNNPISPAIASGDSDDGPETHPLPHLVEMVGSMEVLDAFLPLLASSATLKTLRLIPPHPSVSLDIFLPDISHLQIPTRVLEIVEHSSLIRLSLDLSHGWEMELETFMVYVPSLESLELRGIRENEPMDSFGIFSPLQKLRSLTVAMSIDTDTDDPPSYTGDTNLDMKFMRHFKPCGLVPSVFAHCAMLQDVRLELDGPLVPALKPLWQVWLRLESSKYSMGTDREALELWGSGDLNQYPNLNLFTYMGISI